MRCIKSLGNLCSMLISRKHAQTLRNVALARQSYSVSDLPGWRGGQICSHRPQNASREQLRSAVLQLAALAARRDIKHATEELLQGSQKHLGHIRVEAIKEGKEASLDRTQPTGETLQQVPNGSLTTPFSVHGRP